MKIKAKDRRAAEREYTLQRKGLSWEAVEGTESANEIFKTMKHRFDGSNKKETQQNVE